jgi:hypothetical protein
MRLRYLFVFVILALLFLNLFYGNLSLRVLTSFVMAVHPAYLIAYRKRRYKRLADAFAVFMIILIGGYSSSDAVNYVSLNLVVLVFVELLDIVHGR